MVLGEVGETVVGGGRRSRGGLCARCLSRDGVSGVDGGVASTEGWIVVLGRVRRVRPRVRLYKSETHTGPIGSRECLTVYNGD